MIKVAIADDHCQIRAHIRKMLEKSGEIEVVAEAQDGQQLMQMLSHCQAEVVVLDVEMPVMNGLEVLAQIRELCLPVQVIMLSGYSDKTYIQESLRLGAKAYIVKDEAWHILVRAVKYISLNTGDMFLSRMAKLATEV
jgi:DNA-binding NarL/FixJ family response regulator